MEAYSLCDLYTGGIGSLLQYNPDSNETRQMLTLTYLTRTIHSNQSSYWMGWCISEYLHEYRGIWPHRLWVFAFRIVAVFDIRISLPDIIKIKIVSRRPTGGGGGTLIWPLKQLELEIPGLDNILIQWELMMMAGDNVTRVEVQVQPGLIDNHEVSESLPFIS